MSIRFSVIADVAAKHQGRFVIKQASPAFADNLVKLRAAMIATEGDYADHYARQRNGCWYFTAWITLQYESAAEFEAGKAKSAELEVSAMRPFHRHHDPIYSIHLDPDSCPLLELADWLDDDAGEDEGGLAQNGKIDSDLVDALWSPAARPLAA